MTSLPFYFLFIFFVHPPRAIGEFTHSRHSAIFYSSARRNYGRRLRVPRLKVTADISWVFVTKPNARRLVAGHKGAKSTLLVTRSFLKGDNGGGLEPLFGPPPRLLCPRVVQLGRFESESAVFVQPPICGCQRGKVKGKSDAAEQLRL